MLDAAQVTACLVTRGDQPEMMERIRASLIFENVVVWDNSVEEDWKCAGRYMAMTRASTDYVYFQDDDVVVPAQTQEALRAEFDPDTDEVVANWGHGENPDGYDDLPLVCGGAIVYAPAAMRSIARYQFHHRLDDEFKYEADFVVGALYRNWRHVHLPFHIELPVAQAPERLCNQPWQKAMKYEVTQRARAIRDAERVAA